MKIEALTLSSFDSHTEAERLAALAESHLVDPASARLLQELVEIATTATELPFAWISALTADQEVVVASKGIEPVPILKERSAAHHIAKTRKPLTMEQPAADFPLSAADDIAFYVGLPIKSQEGYPLGVLAVASPTVRSLTATQLDTLQALATLSVRVSSLCGALHISLAELEDRRAEQERLDKVMSRLQDVTIAKEVREAELSERNAELKEMAETDGMTGLRNYRSFDDFTYGCISRGEPIALLLIDIDWFKNFNDAYGHVAGDETLRAVADLIAADAHNGAVAARYGGEEFAVVLRATSVKEALDAAEHLRLRVERHAWPYRPITICVGVAVRTDEMKTVQDLVRRADQALYAAKRNGKNRVLAWTPI